MTTHDLIQIPAAGSSSGRPVRAAFAFALAGALACLAGATAAHAQVPQAAASDASEVGHATQAWAELQRSNREAAASQPLLGDAASYAYRRYIDSFKTKIPPFYGPAAGMGHGSSGGGGANYLLTPTSGSQ
ncbi:DUF3613 domain-containing protein [Burkholderia sp. TSV86]|uniref:DUF3613 domain-containing protein n=1 Tax=Burkholderia sp. TSV86 TaxID=1385594 RepID=UPI00075B036E|nr:DUF3613 domain-containing protein [Burkholderia sp. TSV86]KVE30929.1 hypothetical protein WS68_17585 [Burkholderia sp. TSV86]